MRTRLAFAEIAQAQAEVAAAQGTGSGATVIGAMPLARSVLVARAVLEFAATRPEHGISILDGPYESMLAALRRGSADVLIGALRDPVPYEDIVQEHLFDDPLAIVVGARHPLAGSGAPTLAALARFPWIAPRRDSPLRRHFDALFGKLDVRRAVTPIECNSLVAARSMLLASERVMLLSEHQIHPRARDRAAGRPAASIRGRDTLDRTHRAPRLATDPGAGAARRGTAAPRAGGFLRACGAQGDRMSRGAALAHGGDRPPHAD